MKHIQLTLKTRAAGIDALGHGSYQYTWLRHSISPEIEYLIQPTTTSATYQAVVAWATLSFKRKLKGHHPPRCILNKLGILYKEQGNPLRHMDFEYPVAQSASSYFTTSKILPNCCPLHQAPYLGDCTMGVAGLRLSRLAEQKLWSWGLQSTNKTSLSFWETSRRQDHWFWLWPTKSPKKKRHWATWLRHMLLTSQVS